MLLEAAASEVAEMLAEIDFKASNGWLKLFKMAHSIIFRKVASWSFWGTDERQRLLLLPKVMRARTLHFVAKCLASPYTAE